jgi:hypothetical protein
MSGSSPTVGALAVQIARLKEGQDELRSLVVDVLKEMLAISQVQAEANLKFLQLVEGQLALQRVFTNVGTGSSRTVTDESEAAEWRRTLEAELATDR